MAVAPWSYVVEPARRVARRVQSWRRTPPGAVSDDMSLSTLAVIRWVAVIGQLFAVLFVHFSLGIELPLPPLLAVVGAAVAVNLIMLGMRRRRTRLGRADTIMVFAFDIVQLGLLLGLTGGLDNPFAVLMMLPVAFAATTLPRLPTTLLTALAVVILTVLTVVHRPLPWIDGTLTLPVLYSVAFWLALSMAVVLLAWHVAQISLDARRQAHAYEAMQLALSREQALSALGGQAAAVAHALGSPLATIAVVAKELVREMPASDPLCEDARELLIQAQRCRDVLATLGRPDGNDHTPFTAQPLSHHLRDLAESMARPGVEVRVTVEGVETRDEPRVDIGSEIRHSLGNLIDNAIQFAHRRVTLALTYAETGRSLLIEDDGPGFAPEILDWLGEPYVSSRRRSGGLGLGIFIANRLLARSGAALHFENTKNGARVSIFWPSSALHEGIGDVR